MRIPTAITLLFAFLFTGGASAQRISDLASSDALAARWESGLSSGSGVIAYGFEREMRAGHFIGSMYGGTRNTPSLYERIFGEAPTGPHVWSANRRMSDGQRDQLVVKHMAVLVTVDDRKITDVSLTDMTSPFRTDARSLAWLGFADIPESRALLLRLFDHSETEDAREGVIWSVSAHQGAESHDFLSGVLSGTYEEEIREAAAHGVGAHADPRALSALTRAVRNDRSPEVQEAAVYAIGNTDDPGAVDALDSMIRDESLAGDVRESSLYALSNTDSEAAKTRIRQVALSNDSEMAKTATYALANMLEEDDTDPLTEVLEDGKSLEVRKAALYALSNVGGEKASRALSTVASDATNRTELRKAAIYALGNIEEDSAREALRRLIEAGIL